MKKILLILTAVVCTVTTQAQMIGASVEVYEVHTGMVGSTDLTGYTTYRLFADLTNSTDFVSALFGIAGTPLEINTDTDFWQSDFGGTTGPQVNPLVFPTFPEAEFDSFITIGRANSQDPGAGITATQDGSEPWVDAFNAGEDIVIDGTIGGAWFTLSGEGSVNGVAGDDLKVLIGQFTTNGSFSGFVNGQVFVEGDNGAIDLGTCFPFSADIAAVYGCTDPIATNYSETADVENCSCDYECLLAVDNVNTTSVTCNGDTNGSASITSSGGYGAVTYQLDGGNVLAVTNFNNLSGGAHTITVADSEGCTVDFEFDVPEPDNVTVAITLAQPILCNGQSNAIVNGDGAGGTGAIMYDLTSGLTDPQMDGSFGDLGIGTYTIFAIDENGCTGQSIPLNITQPIAVQVNITGQSDASCSDTEDGLVVVQSFGGTGGLTFTIDGENFQAANIFNVGSGEYSVTAMDANGCTDISNTTAVIEAPDPIDLTIDAANPTCFGDSNGSIGAVAAGGNGGFMYSIDGGDMTGMANYIDLADGTYSIMVVDNENCTSMIDVDIVAPAQVTFTTEATSPLCADDENGEIIVTGAGGTGDLMYSIDGGTPDADNTFGDLGANDYAISVTDENGCLSEEVTVTLDNPEAIVADGEATEESAAGAADGAVDLTVTGGTGDLSYDWTGPNGYSADTEDIDGLETGSYEVTVTDENGCTTTFSTDVVTSVFELASGIEFSISPNPNSGMFVLNIEGLNGEKVSYDILDASGRIISSVQLNAAEATRHEVNMSGAANGMYFMSITVGEFNTTTRIVKQN